MVDPGVRSGARPSQRATATSTTAATSPSSRFRRHATTAIHTSDREHLDAHVEPGGAVGVGEHQHVHGRERGEDGRPDEPQVQVGDRGSRSMPGSSMGRARDG